MSTFEFEKQYKKEFTKMHLQPLLKEINNSIIKVEYAVTQYKEEYIIVTFNTLYIKKICVTANSIKAIVIDCLKEI